MPDPGEQASTVDRTSTLDQPWRVIEGLADWRATVEARRRRQEDYAASRIMPGCAGVADLLGRLERLAESDPSRARSLYFGWRRECGDRPRYTTSADAPHLEPVTQIRMCPNCGWSSWIAEITLRDYGPTIDSDRVACAKCGHQVAWKGEAR